MDSTAERELWRVVKGERQARCVACPIENTAAPADRRLQPFGTEVRIFVDGELMATKLIKAGGEQTCEEFAEHMRGAFTQKGWMPMMEEH